MTEDNLSHLKTVKQLCRDNPSFTEGGVRHLIFHKNSNGFADAFYKVGKRVYVHEARFFECIKRQNGEALHA